MVMHILIIAISHKRCLQSTPGSCDMLFGTWSQTHAYNRSDCMETRLYSRHVLCKAWFSLDRNTIVKSHDENRLWLTANVLVKI